MNIKASLFILVLFLATPAYADETHIFARAPQQSPAVTSKSWSPFIKELSKRIKRKIILKVYTTREDFESDIKKGNVDFYLGNPGYGVVGHLRHGYIPLIRSDKKRLEGILVVKKDSKIQTLTDLDNKRIAFPGRTSFAASLYLRASISDSSNINYQPLFTGTHDNTYRNVLIGKADAGGGVIRTFQQENVGFQKKLRIIYTTPGTQPHPIMSHPNVAVEIRQQIQQAILNMDKSEPGKKLLKNIKLQQPVIADYRRDYKSLEKATKQMYDYLLK